jgi:hypothetical protein
MTTGSQPVTLFPRIPQAAVVTTIVVAFVWVFAVGWAISNHNKMPSRTPRDLPIRVCLNGRSCSLRSRCVSRCQHGPELKEKLVTQKGEANIKSAR